MIAYLGSRISDGGNLCDLINKMDATEQATIISLSVFVDSNRKNLFQWCPEKIFVHSADDTGCIVFALKVNNDNPVDGSNFKRISFATMHACETIFKTFYDQDNNNDCIKYLSRIQTIFNFNSPLRSSSVVMFCNSMEHAHNVYLQSVLSLVISCVFGISVDILVQYASAPKTFSELCSRNYCAGNIFFSSDEKERFLTLSSLYNKFNNNALGVSTHNNLIDFILSNKCKKEYDTLLFLETFCEVFRLLTDHYGFAFEDEILLWNLVNNLVVPGISIKN